MSDALDAVAPDNDALEQIARETVAAFPGAFRGAAQGVALRVVDIVPEHLSDGDDWDLTGLYTGVPIPDKALAQPLEPDAVWLFRLPILLEWSERGNVTLRELVAHVTVHEFAHHFGWSDDDIAAIDAWWR